MSIFPTKILLATEGSEEGQLAATTAARLANITGSELYILTVEPAWGAREACGVLAEHVRKIESVGGEVSRSYARKGSAAEEVCALAEELGTGLIAMGSRGWGRIRRLAMGSVSDSVVRHAHCAVMVVRWKPIVFPAKMLLAIDGSESATLAAKTAADLADRTGCELHVAHVGWVFHGAYVGWNVGPLPPGISQEALDRGARTLLEAEVERVKGMGAEVAGAHLRRGRADEEIVVLAEELGADMVVMGCRRQGGMKRALMGSVSDSVLRHAHCPVLVARA
jgi:nucleotide-binding universal stress UspA family protein